MQIFIVKISSEKDLSVLDFYIECKKEFKNLKFNYEVKTNEDIFKFYISLKVEIIDKINNFFSKQNENLKKIIFNDNEIKILYDYLNFKYEENENPDKFFNYIELYLKYQEELNMDYTQIFRNIIESKDFKELYNEAMKSSFIKTFISNYGIEKNYNEFINNYIENIEKYILYLPLTRGIKAYVSNYFRIIININSIEFIGEIKDKNEIIKTYLLTNLLHESMHFIFRLDKIDNLAKNSLSPIEKKYKNSYSEIGVDLIYYIFKTEYITFYSEENCKIVNDINSWKNQNTNFKIFEINFYEDYKIIKTGEKEEKNGLRSNNSYIDDNMKNDDIENKVYFSSTMKLCY